MDSLRAPRSGAYLHARLHSNDPRGGVPDLDFRENCVVCDASGVGLSRCYSSAQPGGKSDCTFALDSVPRWPSVDSTPVTYVQDQDEQPRLGQFHDHSVVAYAEPKVRHADETA